jgi:NAD(P)-dependent dehydrogenase (short-subunit alcohol dehydrogenase family)
MKLDGKVAFITGAASGIGRIAAEIFAREGARIVVADVDEVGGETIAADIRARGGLAIFVRTDVTDPPSVEAAIRTTVEHFGRLDILYNNAGGSRALDGPVTEAPIDEFWKTLQIDLFGTWLCCKHGIPEIIRSGGGSVVNSSSMVALIGWPGKDSYTCAKGAVAALTRSMAVEYASQGVRVNAVAPGTTLTGRIRSRVEAGILPQSLMDRHILGYLEPAQIARAALFLASDDSSGMTGHVMSVDSGATIT